MNTEYNKKEFLLPESINSCASYHAKIFPDGKYMLRIHDCNTGIRLVGDVNTEVGTKEALNKLDTLIRGVKEFQDFIYQNFYQKIRNNENFSN